MAIAYNKVILIGRLTRDPEVRTTVNGSKVANFSLAVNRQFKTQEVDFINIVAFGRQADFSESYLSKGQLILVEGSLHINKWTDRNDIKRQSAEIWVNNMTFMETKKAQKENNNEFNNIDVSVEDGYEKKKNVNDKFSDELPDFEDPFGNLDDELSSDNNPFGGGE